MEGTTRLLFFLFFLLCNSEKEQRGQHQEKETSRSRIPRLILRPHLPLQQHKVSPTSESPFSEEESREFNSSSGRSARTISSNSFCSGTGILKALNWPKRMTPPGWGLWKGSQIRSHLDFCYYIEFYKVSSFWSVLAGRYSDVMWFNLVEFYTPFFLYVTLIYNLPDKFNFMGFLGVWLKNYVSSLYFDSILACIYTSHLCTSDYGFPEDKAMLNE